MVLRGATSAGHQGSRKGLTRLSVRQSDQSEAADPLSWPDVPSRAFVGNVPGKRELLEPGSICGLAGEQPQITGLTAHPGKDAFPAL